MKSLTSHHWKSKAQYLFLLPMVLLFACSPSPDPVISEAQEIAAPPTEQSPAPESTEMELGEQLDLTSLWSFGLSSVRTGEALIEENGEHQLDRNLISYGYNLILNENGAQISASAAPLKGGEQISLVEDYQSDNNIREYARIFTFMAPIRDTLLYHFEETSLDEWISISEVLSINNIKTVDAASVDPKSILSVTQVYEYIAGGPSDGSPVMRFLEEAELELKCLAFLDFDFTNPEGGNHCEEHNITLGAGIIDP